MSRSTSHPNANRLLASLPVKEQRRLLPTLAAAPLGAQKILHQAGQPIEHIYFPEKGSLILLVRPIGDGKDLEAGLVGFEGAAGVEVFLGSHAAQFTAKVLARGESLRMKVDAFKAEVRNDSPLARRLRHFIEFLLLGTFQVVGCSSYHSLEEHFCSLLLRLQNVSGRKEHDITHKQFARIMGVRRVGITQVARRLQQAGLIRYRWGKLAILDRQGLKARACVCHDEIEKARLHLLNSLKPRP
jgi:CRP-like cAMP-binding protein